MTSVVERLPGGSPVFSVEFFAPRDAADEAVLWRAIRELEALDPAFVSITYGAGGSSRDLTIRTTGRVAQETTLLPMAHLTAVDHSVAELRNVIGWYAAVGVRNILAVRGDPPGDPHGEWVPHPEGLTYAEELVRLCRELGDFCVGVAAFPYGHPRSADLDADTEYLVRKLRAGADFAIAQLFFEPEDFLRLRDRVAARGCDALLLPGLMPLTTTRTLAKTVELSGAPVPPSVARRLDPYADDPAGFRAAGIDLVTEMGERLLAEGVPSLHFYTFNRSKATREIVGRLGLVPARSV
ncbi:methylenetetrahydrofolate reductase [Saccharothrix hoggarensis]|uniref:Methylenetetrahydrofolate reductase n=1 Tax=Saccharothrix hoggarensis TaxID=913853 RepID=A0ABW3QX45_9PSEU